MVEIEEMRRRFDSSRCARYLGMSIEELSLNINFLSAAPVGETLYAEAKVLHAGKTLGVSEMMVVDSNGRTIARATGTTVSLETRD